MYGGWGWEEADRKLTLNAFYLFEIENPSTGDEMRFQHLFIQFPLMKIKFNFDIWKLENNVAI